MTDCIVNKHIHSINTPCSTYTRFHYRAVHVDNCKSLKVIHTEHTLSPNVCVWGGGGCMGELLSTQLNKN